MMSQNYEGNTYFERDKVFVKDVPQNEKQALWQEIVKLPQFPKMNNICSPFHLLSDMSYTHYLCDLLFECGNDKRTEFNSSIPYCVLYVFRPYIKNCCFM